MIIFINFILADSSNAQNKLIAEDCVKLALKNSNLIKSTELSIVQAEKKIAENKAQQLPSVNITGLYTRIGKITSFTMPIGEGGKKRTLKFGTPNKVNFNINLQFPVFTWGKISDAVEISEIGKKLSEVERKSRISEVTNQVLRAYYSVLLNQEIIRLNRKNLKRAENFLKLVERRFKSGGIPRLEFLRARVQFKNTQNSLYDSRSNLIKSKIFLSRLIGRNYKNINISGSLLYSPVSLDEQKLIQQALSTRSELNIINIRQQMCQTQISLAKNSKKPNIFFTSGYNVMNGFDPMNPERFIDNWNAGVQFVFPVFDGSISNYKKQEAEIDLQIINLQKKELKDIIKMQVHQAVITLKQTENNINTQSENIALAKEALEIAEKQYQNGLVSSLDILNAQQTLAQSEFLHIRAIFNYIMAKLDLCKTVEDYSLFLNKKY